MSLYRNALPQLSGELFLTDGGIETDLIFNHGIKIRGFAAHTLLPDPQGRAAVTDYLRGFLDLAKDNSLGFILDSQTWKAHPHWSEELGQSEEELRRANIDAINLISALREEYSSTGNPIVLNGVFGPKGDGYAPDSLLASNEAEEYHSRQLGWLAETPVDMVTALTFTQSDEAIGAVRAARSAGLPIVVSFTVETDGCLPTGQALDEAIKAVDSATDSGAAYFMVNCAHPDHFFHRLGEDDWAHRIRGIRCNASRLSHAELDACEVLDDGDPIEMALQYRELKERLPWLNVFGGCCGSDLRHVTEIIRAIQARN